MSHLVEWQAADGLEALADGAKQAAAAALEALRPEAAAMTVALVDEPTMQRLHHQHMDDPASTDVLSFAHGEPDPETDLEYLGDVIICLAQAERQAEAGGHSVEDELALLAIHGTLHLLGFDHDTPDRRLTMWHQQAAILQSIGRHHRPEVE